LKSQIYRKDGSIIWISENCRAIRDAQGKLLYYEGTVEDISPQREAEAKTARLRGALSFARRDAAPKYFSAKTCRNASRFQPAILQNARPHPGGNPGQNRLRLFSGGNWPLNYQRDDFARHGHWPELRDGVEEHQLPTATKIYVQVVKTPLRGAYGQITGLQGIFWDITPQKNSPKRRIPQANEELAISREQLP